MGRVGGIWRDGDEGEERENERERKRGREERERKRGRMNKNTSEDCVSVNGAPSMQGQCQWCPILPLHFLLMSFTINIPFIPSLT